METVFREQAPADSVFYSTQAVKKLSWGHSAAT